MGLVEDSIRIARIAPQGSAKKNTAVKRPAGKSTGPPGKFRKVNDDEKTAVKKPFIEKGARAQKASDRKATVGQKPFVKKHGDGKKPFVKKAGKPGETKPNDEKPKWFEMKKKDRKKVGFQVSR